MPRYDIEKQKWNEKAEHLHLPDNTLDQADETIESIFTQINVLRPLLAFMPEDPSKTLKVLDVGCGDGWTTVLLAKRYGYVKAFDISSGRVDIVRRRMQINNLHNVEAIVADAESLPYSDNEFDYIFGHAVFHHLRFAESMKELTRVLKPGGKISFCEPMAHNPVINFVRYLKHHYIEKHVGTDRPLKHSDKEIMLKYLSKVEFKESSFFSGRIRILKTLDRWLATIPGLKRWSGYATIMGQK